MFDSHSVERHPPLGSAPDRRPGSGKRLANAPRRRGTLPDANYGPAARRTGKSPGQIGCRRDGPNTARYGERRTDKSPSPPPERYLAVRSSGCSKRLVAQDLRVILSGATSARRSRLRTWGSEPPWLAYLADVPEHKTGLVRAQEENTIAAPFCSCQQDRQAAISPALRLPSSDVVVIGRGFSRFGDPSTGGARLLAGHLQRCGQRFRRCPAIRLAEDARLQRSRRYRTYR